MTRSRRWRATPSCAPSDAPLRSIVGRSRGASSWSSKAEDILHVVQPRRSFERPQGCAHRSVGEGLARSGAMNELDSFAATQKIKRMIAYDIAPAKRVHRDLFWGDASPLGGGLG